MHCCLKKINGVFVVLSGVLLKKQLLNNFTKPLSTRESKVHYHIQYAEQGQCIMS